MKLPRDLKGSDLAKALCRDWGYSIAHQEGSHLILQTEIPSHQRIPIPDHNPIRYKGSSVSEFQEFSS
jgi:hypothetical protein